jgi:hypothetical protein
LGAEPHQFIGRARQLHHGFLALAPLGAAQTHACIFLASWCLELSLKAYLATKGQGKSQLGPIQHNLAALWAKAAELGLPAPKSPPRWCVLLSETHNTPFHQRYPTETAVSIAPNKQSLVAELSALLALIEQSIQ